ncbi:MAG: 50S ribosomal protein L4 [Bacillati bacterium ANGP1]|uniref:Large ribosomal subunit protein uL4 n=1 Tax=Candidatus Segetimicrobium genomatis TaxID=2569760 RepID=A0A537JW05_9BACT|nr:MAG: 50S ribosomal protein L4 [Terrabacteria group bacterium ANGP1]
MSMVTVYDAQGKQVGEVPLPPVLEAKPHTAVLHEALLWQLAGRRRGTHSTLSRGMVDRSTRKLYRQKGTGRARHGGRGAGLFVGGGIIFGPTPRDHGYRLARRVRRLALRSALAARAAAGQFAVLDRLDLEAPKTKVLAGLVRALGWAASPQKRGRAGSRRRHGVLLITAAPDQTATRSAANLPGLRVLPATALNVHDILACEHVLVTREALGRITEAVAP